jgi:hypothetical protein
MKTPDFFILVRYRYREQLSKMGTTNVADPDPSSSYMYTIFFRINACFHYFIFLISLIL